MIYCQKKLKNGITICHFDLLLRGGSHDFDITLELHFQFRLAFHVCCEGGISVHYGDKKLDLQHAFHHGLQAEKRNGRLAYS